MAGPKTGTNGGKEETRVYVCKLADGTYRKIVVPASWKVSFGPVMLPTSGHNGHSYGVAMRLWEGNKDNQRALYSDVVSFYDTTIRETEHATDIFGSAA